MIMKDNVIGLHGKSYNGTPYTINVQVAEGKIKTIVLCGKPSRDVAEIVKDFSNCHESAPENIVNSIKLTMIRHNEYVQTVSV